MFNELMNLYKKPKPFEVYTAEKLWSEPYISQKMLESHLNESVDAASRNKKFVDNSVAWIIDNFKIGEGSSVIDFGCGPGLYTTPIAQAGASVTGIDFSENSIAYAKEVARKNNLTIDYIHDNYLNFSTEKKFDLIIMIYLDFTVLSPDQRSRLLKIFNKILKPNGSILMDVYSFAHFNNKKEQVLLGMDGMGKFWSPEDHFSVQHTFKYDEEKLILDKYTVYLEKEKREFFNWEQCFDKETIINEFSQANLKIVDFLGSVTGTEYDKDSEEFCVIAQKQLT